MRDSFGGVFMIELLLVFIFIYVLFIALSLNYAKAFKTKNSIIDYLEEYQITDKSISDDSINAIVEKNSYNVDNSYCEKRKKTYEGKGTICECHSGILLCPTMTESNIKNSKNETTGTLSKYVWNIETYAEYNLGFLKHLFTLGQNKNAEDNVVGTWKINGKANVTIVDKK